MPHFKQNTNVHGDELMLGGVHETQQIAAVLVALDASVVFEVK